ncbi:MULTISPECIES: sensor histidine kinase [unclassified Sphingomonas]|uniref:sensor histidine kinase n=1 Tax=unclassified Sphingomonas TaxID=196159 RepID=UPI001E3866FD|nr:MULTISPECIES: PAS domain-containing protein [unclassified Sphingomonas]
MDPAPTPSAPGWRIDERARLALLASYQPRSLRDSAALKQITDFAAALCETPIALVTLIEDDDQLFLAKTGLAMERTPRAISFCDHTIRMERALVVPDTHDDLRFATNPLVTAAPFIRFYAGVPLRGDGNVPLGALCVLDDHPRAGLTPLQLQGLEVLAANVMARLTDHRDATQRRDQANVAARALTDSEDRFRTLADTMPQMVWSTLPDGYHDYYNARWYEFTGTPPGSTDGEGWNDMFHPDDQDRAWSVWRHSLATGDPYQIEYRLRHRDGTYRWVLGRALPIRDGEGRITRWFGTCTDIHEQKLALEEREIVSQELSHRIKNIFAVVSGLISFAARGKPNFAATAADLRERITALGRAHDFVRPHSATSARPSVRQDSLHGLLAELFEPYRRDGRLPIAIEGEDIVIDDRSTTPLALLFHELATNASKYGALSTDGGTVTLTVRRGDEAVTLAWVERGGPRVEVPEKSNGFGSQLIELAAVRQLGGEVQRDWDEGGFAATVTIPTAAFSRR